MLNAQQAVLSRLHWRASERWRSVCLLLLITLTAVMLTSCSRIRRDGAPPYYVDASKVPDATPKPEPLSKYGNMKHYSVAGKRYYPMKSSKNFQEVGIASWYGTLFHDQKTSSGERYNMLGMTAAHKTLPLPTYVEVTNLKNHRTIIVKVNDRGPFKPNRIIDLSYVAAKKLGMAGRGTAPVRIKAIDPVLYAKQHETSHFWFANNVKPAPKKDSSRSFKQIWEANQKQPALYIHVGVYRNKAYAEKVKRKLEGMMSEKVTISKSSAKSYRIQVGPIKDFSVAAKLSRKLKVMGMSSSKVFSA